MDVNAELIFYLRCWCELQNVLTEVDRYYSDAVPYASVVLELMKKIEDNVRKNYEQKR